MTMSVEYEEFDSLDVYSHQGSDDVFLDSLEPTLLKKQYDDTPTQLPTTVGSLFLQHPDD